MPPFTDEFKELPNAAMMAKLFGSPGMGDELGADDVVF